MKFWATIKGFIVKVLKSFEREADNGGRTILPSSRNVALLMHVESVSGKSNSTGISDNIATSLVCLPCSNGAVGTPVLTEW